VFGGTLIQHKVAPVDAARTLQWADGWLEFKSGQTIGEAAREFNRHNIEQIEIEQPAIAARELQGPYRFAVDSSAVFARTIAANNDLVLIEDRTGEVPRLRLAERRQ
jgi:ferric-dicitrate binding protein FerR (iron transport regulator)